MFVPVVSAAGPETSTSQDEQTNDEEGPVLGAIYATYSIAFSGNAALLEFASYYSLPGTGTPEDPIIIDGMSINLPTNVNHGWALYFENTDLHVLVNNSYFSGARNTGSGFAIGAAVVVNTCHNITINNSQFYSVACGLYVINSMDITLANTDIDLYYYSSYAVVLTSSCYVTVKDLTISVSGATLYTVYLAYSDNNTFENITSSSRGWFVDSSNYNVFRGNQISSTNQDMIKVADSRNNEFTENTFISTMVSGINLANSDRNFVHDNTFSDVRYAVMLDQATENIIQGNQMQYCSHSFYVVESPDNYILDNNMTDGGSAIYANNLDGIFIQNNTITNMGSMGIGLYGVINARCYSNHLTDASFYIDGMDDGLISHDITVNNTVNGGPVYYYADMDAAGAEVPLDAGQVLLMAVTDMRVHDLDLGPQNFGIQASFCQDLVIENNRLEGMSVYGIVLTYCGLDLIQNNIVNGSETGIALRNGHDDVVLGNTLSNCSYIGLSLYGVAQTKVQENIVTDSGYEGIQLSSCTSNFLYSNELVRASIDIEGGDIEYWASVEIPVNNTVNGRPVYFYTSGTTVPTDAGQVILAGGSGFVLDGLNLSFQNEGLVIGFVSTVTVQNCDFNGDSPYAIHAEYSTDVVVQDSEFIDCATGIWYAVSGNLVADSNVFTNCSTGINVDHSDGSIINLNSFHGAATAQGVYSWISANGEVTNNTFFDSPEGYGVTISYSTGWVIDHNAFSDVSTGVLASDQSTYEVTFNSFEDFEFGVRARSICDGLMDNNTFSSEDGTAIEIWDNCIALVSFNTVEGVNTGFRGFDSDIELLNNTFTACEGAVEVSYCPEVIFSGNEVVGCIDGFSLYQSADSVTSNNLFQDLEAGVAVGSFCDRALIEHNTFVNCSTGIRLQYEVNGVHILYNVMSQVGEYGIYSVENGDLLVTYNTISGTGDGVHLECNDPLNVVSPIVAHNNISCDVGVLIYSFVDASVYDNILWYCGEDGIVLDNTQYNTVLGNDLRGCSINIYGTNIDHWTHHDIATNNTVNGKPIYYLSFAQGASFGLTPPADAGELIFANLGDITVSGFTFDNQTMAVLAGFSTITVNGNTFRDNFGTGMRADCDSTMTVTYNLFLDNNLGAYVMNGASGTIYGNDFIGGNVGLRMGGSSFSVQNNVFRECVEGIYSMGSNNIYENSFIDCDYGYHVRYASDDFTYNVLNGCEVGVFGEGASSAISNNNFKNDQKCVHLQSCSMNIDYNVMETSVWGVYLEGDERTTVTSNSFMTIARAAVYSGPMVIVYEEELGASDSEGLDYGYGTYVSDNQMGTCGAGIYLDHVENGEVEFNEVEQGSVGILLNETTDAYIYGNDVSDHVDGIVCVNSTGMSINRNDVLRSENIGISFFNCSRSQVYKNLVQDSGSFGILMNGSYYNTIEENRFIANNGATDVYDPEHIQAYDDGFVYVDTDAPFLTIDDPWDGYIHTYDDYIYLEWYMYDSGSGIVASMYRIDEGDWETPYDFWSDGGGWYGGSSELYLDEGQYLIEIMALDAMGNQGIRFVNITVDYDYDGPYFDDFWPCDGYDVSLQEDYMEWWVFEGAYPLVDCTLTVDGTDMYLDEWYEDYDGFWYGGSDYFEYYGISEGWHLLTVTVTDEGGNTAFVSMMVEFYEDEYYSPILGDPAEEITTGSNDWNGEYGNYWSDWLAPDAELDSIVDLPYHILGCDAVDELPLAYLVAIPYFEYWDAYESQTYLEWECNYTLVSGYSFYLFRNSTTEGNDVFQTSDDYYEDYEVVGGKVYNYSVCAVVDFVFGITSAPVTLGIPEYNSPDLTIVAPQDGSFTNSTTVEWEVSDSGSGLDYIEIYLDEGDLITLDADATNYTFEGMEAGPHSVTVIAYDHMANSNQQYVEFFLDTDAPGVEIYNPLDGGCYGSVTGGFVIFEWGISEETSEIDHWSISIDGTVWEDYTDDYDATRSVAEGNHTFYVRAWDVAGNVGTASVNFTCDYTNPSVLITSPEDGETVIGTDVTVEWTASDVLSGLDDFDIYLDGEYFDTTSELFYNLTDLESGTYLIEIYAYDMAANYGFDSIEIEVDASVTPQVSIDSPLDGDLFGLSSEGNIEATWSSTGDLDHYEVQLDDSGFSTVGTFVSCIFLDITEGNHTIFVRAYGSGGLYTEDSVEVYMDLTSPEVSIIGAADAGFNNTGSVLLEWTVVEAGSGIDHFDIQVDDGSILTIPGDQSSLTIEDLSEGEHTIVVTAYDVAGNDGSDSVILEVDLTDPTVIIMNPLTGDNLISHSTELQWSATDTGSGFASFDIQVDDGSILTIPGGERSILIEGLSDGSHTIILTAYDNAGNQASDSVTFLVDTTAPAVTITGPLDNAKIASSSVDMVWDLVEAGSGIDHYVYQINDGAEVTIPGDQTSITLSGLEDGDYTIVLTAYDVAGNHASDSVSFSVDTTNPTVWFTTPSTQGWVSASTSWSFSWVGNDNGTGIAGYKWSLDGGAWSSMSMDRELNLTGLGEGSHYLVVKCIDNVNNYGTARMNFTIDLTAPTLDITGPIEGSYFNIEEGNDVTVAWTSDGAAWKYRVNGGAWADLDVKSLLLADLADGAYAVEVWAYDAVGNMAKDWVNFTVDTTLPSVAITAPTGYVTATSVLATWTGSDANLAGFRYKLDSGEWSDLGSDLQVQLTGLAQGNHTLYVKARDLAGNENVVSVAFKVDSIAPTVTGFGPQGNIEPVDSTVFVLFSEQMNASSLVFLVGDAIGTVEWNGNMAIFTPSDGLVHNMPYSITVTGKDLAGNSVTETWVFTTCDYEGILSGVLKDANGNIIAGATVTLENGDSMVTDAEGKFLFQNLAPGSYNITVSRSGYEDATFSVEMGEDQTLDLGSQTVEMNKTGGFPWWILIVAVIAVIAIGLILVAGKRRKKQ